MNRECSGITPPKGGKIIRVVVPGKTLVLLSYSNGGGKFDPAIAWAKENGLGMSESSDVLAIIANGKYTLSTFSEGSMCAVASSTTISGENGRSVVNIWISESGKGNGVMTTDSFGDPDEWIAFVEKVEGEAVSGV